MGWDGLNFSFSNNFCSKLDSLESSVDRLFWTFWQRIRRPTFSSCGDKAKQKRFELSKFQTPRTNSISCHNRKMLISVNFWNSNSTHGNHRQLKIQNLWNNETLYCCRPLLQWKPTNVLKKAMGLDKLTTLFSKKWPKKKSKILSLS